MTFGTAIAIVIKAIIRLFSDGSEDTDIFSVDVSAPKPTDYPYYEESWSQFTASLSELGLELMLKPQFAPDYKVSYTNKDSWAKIVPYLVFPADLYVEEDADCDDYSKAASVKSSMVFKRNGCVQCWGDTPLGRHAFGLVKTGEKSFMLFEPNGGFPFAGTLFKNGEHQYQALSWK